MTIEWTDPDGTRNVFVNEPLSFHVDPLPAAHAYDPMIHRYMNGPEGITVRGPECLGCLPYLFPEDHPIHVISEAVAPVR